MNIVHDSSTIQSQLLKVVVWVVCNITRPKELSIHQSVMAIDVAGVGLLVENEDIRSDSLWALFYSCDNSEESLAYLV